MNDVYVTVATFDDPAEAAMARNLLEAAGIRTLADNENTVATAWHLAGAIGGIRIQVAGDNARQASALLLQAQAPKHEEPEPAEAIRVGPASPLGHDEEERPLSSRAQNASRAIRATVAGVLFLPIQLYAFWLFVQVFFSTEPLDDRLRRKTVWAAAFNLLILGAGFLIFTSFLGPPRSHELDPSLLDRPVEMVGDWISEDGLEEITLWKTAKVHYRYKGAPETDFSGTWGVERWELFVQPRVVKAGKFEVGKNYVWRMAELEREQFVLKEQHGPVRFVRNRFR